MKFSKIIISALLTSALAVSMAVNVSSQDNVKGDINGDGKINVTDAALTSAHVKGIRSIDSSVLSSADVNSDDKVNITDAALIAAHVKGLRSVTGNEASADNSKAETTAPAVTQPTEATTVPHFTFTTGAPTYTTSPVVTTVQTTSTTRTTTTTRRTTTTTTTTTTATQRTYGQVYDFILNINSKKAHRSDCGDGQRTKDKNKRYFTGTIEEVQQMGYSACQKCHPFG